MPKLLCVREYVTHTDTSYHYPSTTTNSTIAATTRTTHLTHNTHVHGFPISHSSHWLQPDTVKKQRPSREAFRSFRWSCFVVVPVPHCMARLIIFRYHWPISHFHTTKKHATVSLKTLPIHSNNSPCKFGKCQRDKSSRSFFAYVDRSWRKDTDLKNHMQRPNFCICHRVYQLTSIRNQVSTLLFLELDLVVNSNVTEQKQCEKIEKIDFYSFFKCATKWSTRNRGDNGGPFGKVTT